MACSGLGRDDDLTVSGSVANNVLAERGQCQWDHLEVSESERDADDGGAELEALDAEWDSSDRDALDDAGEEVAQEQPESGENYPQDVENEASGSRSVAPCCVMRESLAVPGAGDVSLLRRGWRGCRWAPTLGGLLALRRRSATVESTTEGAPAVSEAIELVSDGHGHAVIGSPTAVEPFLAAEKLQATELVLSRLRTVSTAGPSVTWAGTVVASDPGRFTSRGLNPVGCVTRVPHRQDLCNETIVF